ncbi:enoyl-CoA hydratase-related protein [Elioraea thermophila]|uniref:enoyl-CoA hydratase-related protein n=1 Tax=Elioraea thermophila TaxID=2185104 RepID=UPI000DF45408|nr:enoyl-CoA hydratase-related protein [Elioraea thermophila]
MNEPVVLERLGAVRRITLNRPDRLNAFDQAMHARLAAALDEVAADPSARALLVVGAGRAFSAGQDLEAVQDERDLGAVLERHWNPLVRRLASFPLPSVAAVHGVAAGAGLAVALACDLVLAARSAKLLLAFARIGLVPDSGASWQLARLVGPARARGLAMLGETLSGEQAASWGLVWQAVEDAALSDQALAVANRFAEGPIAALVATRRLIDEAATGTLIEALARETEAQRAAGQGAEYAEGLAAFLAKRTPNFANLSRHEGTPA